MINRGAQQGVAALKLASCAGGPINNPLEYLSGMWETPQVPNNLIPKIAPIVGKAVG